MTNNSKNIIWEMHRMFLPELRQELWEQNRKRKLCIKPLLAEDKLEEMNRILEERLNSARPTKFTYYYQGVIKSVVALPIKVQNTQLFLSRDREELIIPLQDLLDIC